MNIKKCDESYKGKELVFTYSTHHYYDMKINGFNISFERTAFECEQVKTFTDTLLSEWLENPELYACVIDEKEVGYIEISHEIWNNRLRISNLWVEEKYRHQGIGSYLMQYALKRAVELKGRAVILETQSCNDKAISFYLKHGFQLIGFDSLSYSNEDRERKEVRMEMGVQIIAK